MNIKRAKEEIKNCLETYLLKDEHGEYVIPPVNQRPLLLVGAPGIGKTQMMEQLARECEVGIVTYTVTHQTGESAVSMPYMERRRYNGREYVVTEHTLSTIVAAVFDYIDKTGIKEGFLFIDEFNAVPKALLLTMRHFLQYKTFGGYSLPEGWVIVAAAGLPEFSEAAQEIDLGILDRLIKIDLKADFDAWKSYAFERLLHPAVISYLDANRDQLFCVEIGDAGQVFATPRGWEDLAYMLEACEKIEKPVDSQVIGRYIEHPNIVRGFVEFLPLFAIYHSEYRIDRVLLGDTCDDLAIRISNALHGERASVINMVLARLNEKFKAADTKESYFELLLEQLKKIKIATMSRSSSQSSTQSDDGGVPEYLGYLKSDLMTELERRKRLNMISREEENSSRDVAERLRSYNRTLIETRCTAWTTGFKQICRLFEMESGEYEELCESILSMMECAFDFLEASFGNGPEVVKFVTELNNNYYSSKFLRDNKCERYYEYNKRLVFESKEDSFKKRLAKL